MPSRVATAADVEFVTATIRTAFLDDPIWGPALRGSDGARIDLAPYWRLFVEGGIRFGTSRIAVDGSAVSIWLPPGEAELADEQLAALETLIARVFDPVALQGLRELYARFEASRAARPEHYYLSLLATHPDHRGNGRGQQLLAESLALWDADGVPAYLESTNPANDHRYVRAGFAPVGGFRAARDDAWVTAMWRPVSAEATR